jgi:hypothetical protein
MSIGTKLTQSVQKEAAMGRPLPLNPQAQEGAVSASATLADHDRLGNLAENIRVQTDAPSQSSTQQKAEKFAERVTYLPERLGYVETDAGGSSILRSTPVTMRGKKSEYFEARVGNDELSLTRFKPRVVGGGREAVPFHVTDDALSRITDDAAQALQTPVRKKNEPGA